MTSRRVELVVEELVLHGFQPSQGNAIGEALARELEHLAQAEGTAAWGSPGGIDHLHAGEVTLQVGARPAAIGLQVARAVHASLAQREGRRAK